MVKCLFMGAAGDMHCWLLYPHTILNLGKSLVSISFCLRSSSCDLFLVWSYHWSYTHIATSFFLYASSFS